MRSARLVAMSLLAASTLNAQTGEPRRTGVTERVDVDLVLLDVTVVNRKNDVLTGLAKDDFKLKVDDKRVEIASLDIRCPESPAKDPAATAFDDRDDPWAAPDTARRLVFALDYRHLERVQRVDVLRQLRHAVERLHRSKEQLMVVALTDFLRIEQTWSSDPETVLATLERMENDITLWEPPFDHLHDRATFAALLELTELLGTLEGEKTVVLFSNWPSSGLHHDVSYDRLAARSARARVSFYPVWTRGLTPRGTSRRLARLAVETAGRFTERTNDFSLAYARAQRDSACRYTIGFYDSSADPDRQRRIVLRVKRPRTRVFHHTRYVPGDPDETRERIAEAALALPSPYASESVGVALLPLHPTSPRRWKTVLAVQAVAPAEVPVRVRAEIRRGNTRWVRKKEERRAPFTAAESYRLRAGSYTAAATVSYAGDSEPRAAGATLELPAVEGDGWLLVDPIVLRSSVAGGDAPENGVEAPLEKDPLSGRVPVLLQAATDDELSVTTHLCRHGRSETAEDVRAHVSLSTPSGSVFDATVPLTFPRGTRLHCGAVDEPLPRLAPGHYAVTVRARPGGSQEFVGETTLAVVSEPPS